MRKITFLLTGIFFFATAGTFAQSTLTPVEYNNKIISIQTTVINAIITLSGTFEQRNHDEMDSKYSALKKITEKAVEDISKLSSYEGNSDLKTAAKNLFVFYKETVATDYAEMIKILKKKDTDITEKDIQRIDEISAAISAREKVLDERFAEEQKNFAKKYNFTIEENELQKEIDNMSK